jgi:hypothetical protein
MPDGIAGDIVEGVRFRDVARRPANDNQKLVERRWERDPPRGSRRVEAPPKYDSGLSRKSPSERSRHSGGDLFFLFTIGRRRPSRGLVQGGKVTARGG